MSENPVILTPESWARIKDLSLVARGIVDGMMTGLHKSLLKGQNLEFSEYREYVPGDEIKNLDWRMYAKTGKFWVKRFEADTEMRVFLLIDSSHSMAYGHGQMITKWEYTRLLAAALSYLAFKQKDQLGLGIFDEGLKQFIPPKQGQRHLRECWKILNQSRSSGKTSISSSVQDVLRRLNKRCLIILISDLLDNGESCVNMIRQLKAQKHEVLIFQILDESEKNFPFTETLKFTDMETFEQYQTDPLALRDEYVKEVMSFVNNLKIHFRKMGVDFESVTTLYPFEYVLSNYLKRRSG